MARTIAKELNNRRDGDRRQCATCNPRQKGVVRADRLWTWSLAHPGVSPFREEDRQDEGPALKAGSG